VAQRRGGRIVNFASVHEHSPLANAGAYVVSKHGLGGLTKSLAIELAPHRILVNSVAPGFIATPMTNLDGADVHAIEKKRIPLGRPGDPAEIAGLVVRLCSDAASYVTGQSFVADGGFLLANPQFPEALDAPG
jgi:NAD(P)-dependent dehydrogenase (short-subunit alcohol dehydrogenase family)